MTRTVIIFFKDPQEHPEGTGNVLRLDGITRVDDSFDILTLEKAGAPDREFSMHTIVHYQVVAIGG